MERALREGFSPGAIMFIGSATSIAALVLMIIVTSFHTFDYNVLESTMELMERSFKAEHEHL